MALALRTGETTDLRAEAETILRTNAATIASAMIGTDIAGALRLELLRRSSHASTYRGHFEDAEAVVKVFHDTAGAKRRYFAEKTVLDTIAPGLGPRLMLAADEIGVLVTEVLEMPTLETALRPQTATLYARAIGAWSADLSTTLPCQRTDDTWWDYMSDLEDEIDPEPLHPAVAELADLPIGERRLAHNDTTLSRLLAGPNGGVVGTDFANAQLKPSGWDLVTAGVALAARAPDRLVEIAGALVSGYTSRLGEHAVPPGFTNVLPKMISAMRTEAA